MYNINKRSERPAALHQLSHSQMYKNKLRILHSEQFERKTVSGKKERKKERIQSRR